MKKALCFFICSAASALAGPAYQVHEWGTFTTVAGSDGELLAGLDREEERLPAFVHSHYGFENGQTPDLEEEQAIWKKYGPPGFGTGSKGLANRPLTGVTVKMETPVIYFHSPEALHATVKVGFEGGTISQWYPARTKGDVPPMPAPPVAPTQRGLPLSAWTLDFSQDYHGSIQWDVDVLSPAESAGKILFKPGDTLSWLRARVPGTNVVKTAKGETEGYLFYRGVGHFNPGLTTTVDTGETLHLDNRSGGKIPYLVAVERQPDLTLRWKEWSNGLEAGASADLEEKGFTPAGKGFAAPLYHAMIKGLADQGLTHDEARAMVETWWNSYFETAGL
ncbi:MAG: hypothetical protein JWO82_2218, partial [Akkermansiaceae bacterium]|nr:hypothetical protein [Akkermansiaceae bacterium]